ncbi:AAA family ATPase [Vibrio lentus]
MSESIVIQDVASYSADKPVVIDITKPNTFLYGLNGTGKSTISNLFYQGGDKFKSCKVNVDGPYNVCVYNQAFVEDNFYNKSEQSGIFTLSKDNKDIEIKIEEKEKEKADLLGEYNKIKDEVTRLTKLKDKENTTVLTKVFEKKAPIVGTSLERFLTGYMRSKPKFYGKVKASTALDGVTLSDLISEMDTLNKHQGDTIPKLVLPFPPSLTLNDLEKLKQPLVGSSTSQLSSFIDSLGNQAWVQKGQKDFLAEDQTVCPFCQKDTIDSDFRKELSNLFDESFEKGLEELGLIHSSYQELSKAYVERVKQLIDNCSIYDEATYQASIKINALEERLKLNLSKIAEKIATPSSILEYDFILSITDIQNVVDSLNGQIDEINLKTAEHKKTERSIELRMWAVLRQECDDLLSLADANEAAHDTNLGLLKTKQGTITGEGRLLKDEIAELRTQVSDLEGTIQRINGNLSSLGLVDFEIIKSGEGGKFFSLKRGGASGVDVYKSLSEGEKTLITFLYFLEMCNGSDNKEHDAPISEKIVVIDDPISSLSQNYIYDIAHLIYTRILKGYRFKKVIVLTHSLFFFHELVKLASNKKFSEKYSLYRVCKNENSYIKQLHTNDLLNEYQSLWQILKDVKEQGINAVVLPNIMRNILEYYFGFVHKKGKLYSALQDLEDNEKDQEFKAFYRYINRESHSDPSNIGLITKIDPDAYLIKFKKVFEKTNDEFHYECMIE